MLCPTGMLFEFAEGEKGERERLGGSVYVCICACVDAEEEEE